MGFLLRRLLVYGRWLALAAATTAAAGLYGVLSTREEIALFGGAPHAIEWWEPYVWPAVSFVVVGRVLRMALNRLAGAATETLTRLRR
ncbi:MAG: hypothetical protein COW30_08720 [Rhodospirillales bacterium CG15_BIG_FIL_POST_REV_8_21_14_020_66_15]|nr:MAG: hypothetical protein COW30_08720 [Rhodospirillales bacterium CG15_BIG_FIL_POST_REV_8_21_14_020_66_15]